YGGASFGLGKVGNAFNFNGTSGHLRVPDASDLHFGSGLTIEAWIFSTAANRVQTIAAKWDAAPGINQRAITFNVYVNNKLTLGVSRDGTDGTALSAFSSSTIPLNQWIHVAGTYDGTTVAVYVNGQLQGTAVYSTSQPIFPGTDDLGIGGV